MKDITCVKEMGVARSDATDYDLMSHENIISDSDQGVFHLMGLTEKEFSMPYSMKICHDASRIFGLQLTLAMNRIPFENEQQLIDQYGRQDYIDELDRMIQVSSPRRMKFIGKTGADEGATCETRRFFRDNKFSQVYEIIVGTDRTGVRSVQLVLMHDEEHTENEVLQYGYEHHSGDSTKYQFRQGMQLLGISSRIFFDSSGEMPERLISLDFFTNHCARTQQLFWTAE